MISNFRLACVGPDRHDRPGRRALHHAQLDHLDPGLRPVRATSCRSFTTATGLDVHVVAVGTGQALAIGARGDADALLVHDRAGEDKFVADGFGIDRRDVMYNDFVIVGPNADPAHIRGLKDAREALRQIAGAGATFASRGDDSGTNRMELRLWKSAGIAARQEHAWYRDLGQGMGPTLNISAAMNAYTLTDRATWANFKNRQSLEILTEGDPALFNPYGSILVNPAKWPQVKSGGCADLARMAHLESRSRRHHVLHDQRRATVLSAAPRQRRINGRSARVLSPGSRRSPPSTARSGSCPAPARG